MSREMHALVCPPSNTIHKGQRKKHLGGVDTTEAKKQHCLYRSALESMGYSLITMPADDRYPDSTFVEDPGIIIGDKLIVARLCHESRRGEEEGLKQVLWEFFSEPLEIKPPGFIEGGDVLVADGRLYIGLSSRTNENGAEQLARIARDLFGHDTEVFPIPEKYLHLKGEVTFHGVARGHDRNTITASEEIVHYFANSNCRIITTPAEERFGGNCISVGNRILVHANCLKTKSVLERAGFRPESIDLSEFAKIDGAMTCLSKLWG